ncbi:Mating-type protein MAT alpha 1 HMG-box [Nakaseomyces glabratus]|nr:Mating-type protein MAT alpha 1 HMG-box [Nakaseomyces glabratus]
MLTETLTMKYTATKFRVRTNKRLRSQKYPEKHSDFLGCSSTKSSFGLNMLLTKPNKFQIPPPHPVLLKRIREERMKLTSSFESGINIIDIETSWEIDKFISHHFNTSIRNVLKSKSSSKKRPMNAFMAFRTYYAQLGTGLKQNTLSVILSEAWNAPETDQNIWDIFAQQFNFASPRCGFVNYIMAHASSAP